MNKFSVRGQERRHATGYLVQLRRSVVNFDIFLTWNVLASFAGAAAITGLFTQMLKIVRGLVKLPTQWLSYFIAVFVLGVTTTVHTKCFCVCLTENRLNDAVFGTLVILRGCILF